MINQVDATIVEELVPALEATAGMSMVGGNWNKTFLPDFQGTPLDELFRDRIEPLAAAMRAQLIAAGELPADTA